MILNTSTTGNAPEIRTSYLWERGSGDCGKITDVLEWAIPSWKDNARSEVKKEHSQHPWLDRSVSLIPLRSIRSVIARTIPRTEPVPSKAGGMQRPLHTILIALGQLFSELGKSDVNYIILKSEQISEVEEASDLRAIHENLRNHSGDEGSGDGDSKGQSKMARNCFVFTEKRAGFDVGSILPAVQALKDEKNNNGPDNE